MRNLQDATERICELKGSLVALDVLVPALLQALNAPTRARLLASFDVHAEAARAVMLHADISDLVLATFERDSARNRALLEGSGPSRDAGPPATVDELLLRTTRITTFDGAEALGSASGFLYRDGGRLFLVSTRHVFADAQGAAFPDRVEIGLHTDPQDLARYTVIPLPLYRDGQPLWRETRDAGGTVDVATLEVPADSLPPGAAPQAFDDTHLGARDERVDLGDALTIAGFAQGAHDAVHHLAVARRASVASAYGVPFQGQGCFLTEARTHLGSSGAPVVRRRLDDAGSPPCWQLIGVHAIGIDPTTRGHAPDGSHGLHCAWYADVLPELTREG